MLRAAPLLIGLVPFLSGFVLLSGNEEARLNVSLEAPRVEFVLTVDHPSFTEKEEFLGGVYANFPDAQLWPIIVQEAMNRWNAVHGSYVQMALATGGTPTLDSEDGIHSIVIDDINLSAAAQALPVTEGSVITDCDITVSSRTVGARSLAYTIMHELGHCLGLGHNHTNYNAVMGYARDSRTLTLGADDMAGAVYLYPDPEGDAPKELISCAGAIGWPGGRRWPALILLFLPLALAFFGRRSRPVGARF